MADNKREDDKLPDGILSISTLTKMMVVGKNSAVMDYLRTLPTEERDEVRTQLIKNLEAMQKKRSEKPKTGTVGVSSGKRDRTSNTSSSKKESSSSSKSSSRGGSERKKSSSSSVRKKSAKEDDGARVVGNYKLLEEVGKGMYGIVHRALNSTNNHVVAIKEIDLQMIETGKLDGVMKEAQLLSKLDHANIVRIYDSLRDQNKIYFVLEYIDCGSLAKLLRTIGTFPVSIIAHLLRQTLEGLAYLHEKNVIHRDIKSDNLLICSEGIVKLADFGTAKEDVGKTLTVIGTPYWMAPEIIEVSGARPTSDIWSLGCTIIEMLTCHPPYYELTSMQALFSIVDDVHPPMPSGLSPELSHFLLQCCFVKNPEKRATSRQLLEHEWFTQFPKRDINFEEIKNEILSFNENSTKAAKNPLKTRDTGRSLSTDRDRSAKTGSRGRKKTVEELVTIIRVVAEERDRELLENAALKQRLLEIKKAK
eukprot:TRINITY_DN15652_c0_g1_i1.p1 TRINITY_DN15652_c0_g1~~TRINITY_DN15652_c0_g1_i1.p1  ORF type:complete len:477 (-),score=75.13 TRINITY_DN15652_c0_g1_i1:56-1486(-)